MFKKVNLIAALVLSASIFVGCGDDSTTTTSPLLPDAVEADASLATGQVLAQSLVTSLSASSSLPINSVDASSEGINNKLIGSKIVEGVLHHLNSSEITNTLNAAVDITYSGACYISGSYSQSGTVDDVTGAVNATISFSNCDDGIGAIFNGSLTIASNFNATTGDGTISVSIPSTFTLTDTTASGYYFTIYAGTSISMTLTGTQMELSQTIKIDANGALFGSLNTHWIFEGFSAYQTSGREYLNNLTSYIDYDTSYDMSATPLVDDGAGNLSSGEMRYIFSNGAHIKLIVTNVNEITVYLDADGDNVYENSIIVNI